MKIPSNILYLESSPYLLQHKDNPVAWFPWGENAFAAARSLNRPIFLSIGYSACHWCHVMAHESFEDAEIAAILNQNFIAIKVDREEMPDIDAFYMSSLQAMGEAGGWPLSIFLTPQLEPFFGGTYFPPQDRYGRPSFAKVLKAIAQTYQQEPSRIQASVTSILAVHRQQSAPSSAIELSISLLNDCAERFLSLIDSQRGGVSGSPKFPQVPLLLNLWRAYQRTQNSGYRQAVVLTLENLCRGGIYDHLAGGFCRYSTDEFWLVPHFEKMLYDNALLIELLTLVWQETRSPLFEHRIEQTIDWMLSELWIDESTDAAEPADASVLRGGFAAALDADSLNARGDKREGAFYIWTESEVDQILQDSSPEFKSAYGVTTAGNWLDPHHEAPHNGTILNQLHYPMGSDSDRRAEPWSGSLQASMRRLLEQRNLRPRPARDYKILADWNGMAITALVAAATGLERPDWLARAEAVFAFVSERMMATDQSGRLHHSYFAVAQHPALLDDYAQMIRAALSLYQATERLVYRHVALQWVKILDADYWDGGRGGYFMSDAGRLDLLTRVKSAADSATPNGNAVMVENHAKLYYLTGDQSYRERAEAIVDCFSGAIPRSPLSHAALLNGFETLVSTVQIVLVLPEQGFAADLSPWYRAVASSRLNDWVVQVLSRSELTGAEPSNPAPPFLSAPSSLPKSDGPLVLVCFDQHCSLPITNLDEFRDLLAKICAGRMENP
ncbi:MAG: thioredoxin domain-containing protein [Alphaproteobacteria bacterium]|nr:thioredoxin domain-containing protein [Alphaproteobacteria bacterium]